MLAVLLLRVARKMVAWLLFGFLVGLPVVNLFRRIRVQTGRRTGVGDDCQNQESQDDDSRRVLSGATEELEEGHVITREPSSAAPTNWELRSHLLVLLVVVAMSLSGSFSRKEMWSLVLRL